MKNIWYFLRYDIPYGIQNLINFFVVVWTFRSFDHSYTLDILRKSIELTAKDTDKYSLHEGSEHDVGAMNRCVEILNSLIDYDYYERAEKELGFKIHHGMDSKKCKGDNDLYEIIDTGSKSQQNNNSKIFKLSDKIESDEWNELFKILIGDEKIKGSNMKAWWY